MLPGMINQLRQLKRLLFTRFMGYAHRGKSRAEVFSAIFANNVWGDAESVSGAGSNLEETAVLRATLPTLLPELGIRSLLDAPCGDFNWMSQLDLKLDHYYGADIVADLINRNSAKFGNSGRTFLTADLVQDQLPKADAIHCRDCLVHLSLADARAVLANFKRSGATWLLATHFPKVKSNADIVTGSWRPLNLTRAPFDFPEPERLIVEGQAKDIPMIGEKTIGVWRLQELPLA